MWTEERGKEPKRRKCRGQRQDEAVMTNEKIQAFSVANVIGFRKQTQIAMQQQKTQKRTEAERTEGNMLRIEGNKGKRTNYFVSLVCKHACLITQRCKLYIYIR